MEDRHRLRATFAEEAELYERARPVYPTAVFDDLAAYAHLDAGPRVLEIGCGTGQPTLPLAERGYRVIAVELGPEMAAVTQRRLAGFPGVRVIVSAFEDWRLPDEPFDAVVCATAFHWIDPQVRVAKSAPALRPGDERFFAEVQSCYERWDPTTPPGLRLSTAASIPMDGAELDASGAFEAVTFRRHEWDLTYTASAYRDVLLTYSGHRALDSARRAGLLECITDLIHTSYGGNITNTT
jgi:SAM-dependent methyltransferase